MNNRKDILLSSRNSTEALARLFAYHKALNPKVSLAYLCRHAQISSRGYLSDVMQGRRLLMAKYRKPLGKALGLDILSAEYLELLIAKDAESEPAKRAEIDHQLKLKRKSVAISARKPMHAAMGLGSLPFEIFCAFGLVKTPPKLRDFMRLFSKRTLSELSRALDYLVLVNALRKEGEHFHLNASNIRFDESSDGISHIQFLEDCIQDALSNCKKNFSREDTYIESSIISTSHKKYSEYLAKIRATFIEMQSYLEEEKGDCLLRFNVQIFPQFLKNLQ